MLHQDHNDITLLKLTNRILIGRFQDPHLSDDLAWRAIRRRHGLLREPELLGGQASESLQ
jgi:hypothetical protein